VIKNFKMVKA